ncbi:hypothetical protein [Streptomyces sp. NPDC058653]|uniref:hypothetical protein n=1 Tax=Streptomyces sp. NPDC058653 TaxID=3346576 RepID=UPI00364699DC
MNIRLGRWQVEYHQRAIHIQKQPDPKCQQCKGNGDIARGPGVGLYGEEPDLAPCPCWDPYRSLRIPLWCKPAQEAWPF